MTKEKNTEHLGRSYAGVSLHNYHFEIIGGIDYSTGFTI